MLNQGNGELGKQLLQALKRNWLRKAAKLIKAGASLDVKDAAGNRAIDLAKKAGNDAIIDLITAATKATTRSSKPNKK